MISKQIGRLIHPILKGIVQVFAFCHVNPNHLTFLGFIMSIVTAYVFSQGRFITAGFVLITAGLFDMIDGEVARNTESETPFGAFFDSVMDRYSDLIIYLGLAVWYGKEGRMSYVLLVDIVMIGSVLTSYARARAESLIPKCKVGFLERPERTVLLIIGSFYFMDPVVWVLAVLSHWTVIHRIIYTRAKLTGKWNWVIVRESPAVKHKSTSVTTKSKDISKKGSTS